MSILSALPFFFYNFKIGELCHRAAVALTSSLWEGVLLAAVIALFLALLPGTTAKLRFRIWGVAFTVLGGLTVWNFFCADRPAPSFSLQTTPHLQLGSGWSSGLSALWAAAMLVRFVYLALQAIKLRSLWNSAVPVSTELLPELRLGRVELCTSEEIDRPSVIGFFAPRILIPSWLFEQLTSSDLGQIVLHEMEHLRRRDDWFNLLQKIGLVLFPLNPALFWIDRRLATERELACDDGVLDRTNAPRAYATCLTSLAERRLGHRNRNRVPLLAPGAIGAVKRSDFSLRIESILRFGMRPSRGAAPARAMVATIIAGVLAGGTLLAHAPQLVTFDGPTIPNMTQPAAAQLSAPRPVRTSQMPPAGFENVAFHSSEPSAFKSPARRRAKPKLKSPATVAYAQTDTVYSESAPGSNERLRRWIVMASWQQSAPQPMLVTLPDGRTFLATYATGADDDSVRSGWFLIQL